MQAVVVDTPACWGATTRTHGFDFWTSPFWISRLITRRFSPQERDAALNGVASMPENLRRPLNGITPAGCPRAAGPARPLTTIRRPDRTHGMERSNGFFARHLRGPAESRS